MHKITFLSALLSLFIISCDRNGSTPPIAFNRQEMLVHYADNLIVPRFNQLNNSVNSLQDKWQAFENAPDATTFSTVLDQWKTTMLDWEHCSAFNFGPAGETGLLRPLNEEVATFPVDVNRIEVRIAGNLTNFNDSERNARGLLALDYLFFENTPEVVIEKFKQSAARKQYVAAIIAHLNTRIKTVANEWNTYKTAFTESDGTEAGSSTSLLYNEFVRSYESIKDYKVGLPAGKRPGQTQPEPQLLEGFYSNYSLTLLREHIIAIEWIYEGKSSADQDGPGLKDYLEKATGGPELITATLAQWAAIRTALDAMPTDKTFAELMLKNDPAVDKLHTELQKHTRFFKSDMSSLLGIAITFNDGDGD